MRFRRRRSRLDRLELNGTHLCTIAADCGLTLIRSHGRGEDTVDSSGPGEVRGGAPRRIGNAGSPVPRVSIVIPAFNRLDYTRRCLESVEHLTYPNFETLLVDNGSADGT